MYQRLNIRGKCKLIKDWSRQFHSHNLQIVMVSDELTEYFYKAREIISITISYRLRTLPRITQVPWCSTKRCQVREGHMIDLGKVHNFSQDFIGTPVLWTPLYYAYLPWSVRRSVTDLGREQEKKQMGNYNFPSMAGDWCRGSSVGLVPRSTRLIHGRCGREWRKTEHYETGLVALYRCFSHVNGSSQVKVHGPGNNRLS